MKSFIIICYIVIREGMTHSYKDLFRIIKESTLEGKI